MFNTFSENPVFYETTWKNIVISAPIAPNMSVNKKTSLQLPTVTEFPRLKCQDDKYRPTQEVK